MKFDFNALNFEVLDANTNAYPDIFINQNGVTFTKKVLDDLNYPAFVLCQLDAKNKVFAVRMCKSSGNVKKCAVGKYPKSEKHGNTAQFSEVERSGTQEKCGGIGSGCRLRLRPLPVLRRRQSQRVARIDPNAVVVDKNIAENDRFDLFSR